MLGSPDTWAGDWAVSLISMISSPRSLQAIARSHSRYSQGTQNCDTAGTGQDELIMQQRTKTMVTRIYISR